jgi:hypothetical protein
VCDIVILHMGALPEHGRHVDAERAQAEAALAEAMPLAEDRRRWCRRWRRS